MAGNLQEDLDPGNRASLRHSRGLRQGSVAEGDAEVARRRDDVRVERDALQLADRVIQRDGSDDGRIERDHGAEAALGDEADGGGAEAERDEAVVGGGRAAALEMAEDERAGLVAGALLDLRGEALRNAAQPRGARSEEHTSELQSRENLVCRLLLEKKKKT